MQVYGLWPAGDDDQDDKNEVDTHHHDQHDQYDSPYHRMVLNSLRDEHCYFPKVS